MTKPKKPKAENGTGPRQWTLSWKGSTFTAADLTVGDWAALELVNGGGWDCADPTLGPGHAANLLAVLVARAETRPLETVMAEIASLPASALVEALGSEPVEV